MSAHHHAAPCGMDHDPDTDQTSAYQLAGAEITVARILGHPMHHDTARLTPRQRRQIRDLMALTDAEGRQVEELTEMGRNRRQAALDGLKRCSGCPTVPQDGETPPGGTQPVMGGGPRHGR